MSSRNKRVSGRGRGHAHVRGHVGMAVVSACISLILTVACGQSGQPDQSSASEPQQQSPLTTPTTQPTTQPTTAGQPTSTQPPQPTSTSPGATSAQLDKTITPAPTTLVPTVNRFETPGTADTRSTSQAVVATLTAQALPPTPPPTPRPGTNVLRPIGAGANNRVPPTATPLANGVLLVSKSERVFPGGAATLTIRTRPEAVCSLQLARSQSDGTITRQPIADAAARVAGSDGVVAWIWLISANEPDGQLPLIADCGDAGAAQFAIEVSK